MPREPRTRCWISRATHETISNITDTIAEEVKAGQQRPLEEIYPSIYLDGAAGGRPRRPRGPQ